MMNNKNFVLLGLLVLINVCINYSEAASPTSRSSTNSVKTKSNTKKSARPQGKTSSDTSSALQNNTSKGNNFTKTTTNTNSSSKSKKENSTSKKKANNKDTTQNVPTNLNSSKAYQTLVSQNNNHLYNNQTAQANNLPNDEQGMQSVNQLQNASQLPVVPVPTVQQQMLQASPIMSTPASLPLASNTQTRLPYSSPNTSIENIDRIEKKLENMENSNSSIIRQLNVLDEKMEKITNLNEKLKEVNETVIDVRNSMRQIENIVNEAENDISDTVKSKRKLKKEKSEKTKNNYDDDSDDDDDNDNIDSEIDDILNEDNTNSTKESKANAKNSKKNVGKNFKSDKIKPNNINSRKKISLLTEKDLQEIFDLAKDNSTNTVKNNPRIKKLLKASTISNADKTLINKCIELGQKVKNNKITEEKGKKQLEKISADIKEEYEDGVFDDEDDDEQADTAEEYDIIDADEEEVETLNLDGLDTAETEKAVEEFLNNNKKKTEKSKNSKQDKKTFGKENKSSNNGKCTIKLNVQQDSGKIKSTCAESLVDKTLKVVDDEQYEETDDDEEDLDDLLS